MNPVGLVRRNLHWVVASILLVAILFAYFAARRAVADTIESSGLQHAAAINATLLAFREAYTAELVPKVRHDFELTHDFADNPRAVPLPATMTMLVASEISGSEELTVSLYSPYPFPWREESGGLSDSFRREAWTSLNSDPDMEYYEISSDGGTQFLRYARADLLTADCVGCHNDHPDSPKTDWTEGDVRGVLETSIRLDAIVQDGRREVFWLEGSIALLIVVAAGCLTWLTVSYQDRLSVEHRLTAELSDANSSLTQRNHDLLERSRELEQLAYRASHDLKAPLTAMRTMMTIGRHELEAGNGPMVRESLERAGAEADRLQHLVVGIIDKARADLKSEPSEDVDPETMLEDLHARISGHLEEHEVAFTWNIDLDRPLHTERLRLQQILENLVRNAIWYSDRDKTDRRVHVSMHRESGSVVIEVADNGVGIPEEFLPRIFDNFTRFHPDLAEGSGIGTSIVKTHVEALSGEIRVESSAEGTTFTVTLPES